MYHESENVTDLLDLNPQNNGSLCDSLKYGKCPLEKGYTYQTKATIDVPDLPQMVGGFVLFTVATATVFGSACTFFPVLTCRSYSI